MTRIKKTLKVPTLINTRPNNLSEDELVQVLMKLNILMQAALVTQDELDGTVFYRHEIKKAGNLFKDEVAKHAQQHFVKVFQMEEEVAMYYWIKFEQAAEVYARLNFDELSIVSSLLEWYNQDPERATQTLVKDLDGEEIYKEYFKNK